MAVADSVDIGSTRESHQEALRSWNGREWSDRVAKMSRWSRKGFLRHRNSG